MAKYSDYFSMQDFLPVYDITAELQPNAWKSFIPTKQFETLLQRSLSAITSTDTSKRLSLWVRGTFGTGKSHASSVIKHLLCDDKTNIEDYAQSIADVQLRQQLLSFRTGKKLFPVVIKGVEGAYDVPRFKLSIQRETKKALRDAGYSDLVVKSDYEIAVDYIKEHDNIIRDVIEKDIQLRVMGKTPEDLIKKLQSCDNADVYMQLETSLNKQSTYLQQNSISDWLQSVEQEIEQRGIADGLIIFWDEFTSVLDTIKSDRINVLQNIAEKSRHCNLFLFLISHRVEHSTDLAKMDDRFDIIDYKMNEVSAYLIMRHTYATKSDDVTDLKYSKFHGSDDFDSLLTYLSPNGLEEKKSISDLYPLHPYTAYLCSRMADHIGSANRSVVKFMHDEKAGFAAFINEKDSFEQKRLLTADWLWDFFTPSFESNEKCSLFVSTYNSHRAKCEQKSPACLRVFKVVLLLNALSVNFDDETKAERLTPNETNLIYMFVGDLEAQVVKESLEFLDEKNIVSRNVLGEFKIAISSYSPAEIQQQKSQINQQYQTAVKFLNYNEEERKNLVDRMSAPSSSNRKGVLYRPCELQIYSCEDNEAQIQSMLRKYDAQKPNYIHIAYFLSITPESREAMNSRLPELSKIAPHVLLVLPETELTAKIQTQFVDALATHQLAKSRFNDALAADNEKQAKTHIKNWMAKMAGGSYKIYLDGECYTDGILININRLINQTLAYKLFPHGFEQVPAYRSGATANTFFNTGGANATIKKVVEALDRDSLIKFTSSNIPAKEVFEHNGNILVDAECRLTPAAKVSDAWLVSVCEKVDECMNRARAQYQDRFMLSEVLAPFLKAPYGFFQTPSCFVALSYALRSYKEDLFLPGSGQQITEDKLEDMIAELFRLWSTGEVGANSNKLYLRFGSPEESKMVSLLKELFVLRKVPGVKESDIKSFALAKFAIQEFCKVNAKRPLWAAKYCKSISSYKPILEELIELLDQETPQLDKIKKIVQKLEHNKEDLLDILSDVHSYEEGFDAFLDNIKNITIAPEWREDLMKEIAFGLPPEIAFWKETEVEVQVLQYHISKTKVDNKPASDEQQNVNPNTNDGANTVDTSASNTTQSGDNNATAGAVSDNTPANPDAKRLAKNKVRSMVKSSPEWQMMILELLNSHPEISDYINQNWD